MIGQWKDLLELSCNIFRRPFHTAKALGRNDNLTRANALNSEYEAARPSRG